VIAVSTRETNRSNSSDNEERSILKWGGLAGVISGIIFILVPITLFGFGPSSSNLVDLVARFPEFRTVIAAGNFINFVSDVLLVALLLGLYRALRPTSPTSALLGTVLTTLGLGVLFIETTTQVAFDPISSLYQASAASASQQSTYSLVWQATQGMFNQFDTSAVLLFSVGLFVLGLGIIRAPVFGKIPGMVSMALGAMSVVVAMFFGTTSVLAAVLIVPIFVVLPIILGWKLYNQSKRFEREPVAEIEMS
jgi:Domain of unknown function (DUF4386)